MIVWGGCCDDTGGEMPGGAAYRPETGSWRVLPESDLAARQSHVAAWAGDRMVLWGGQRGVSERFADGAAYDPATDRWFALPPAPLQGRAGAAAVWTGTELLVWGGCCGRGEGSFANGAALVGAASEPSPVPEPTRSETPGARLEPEDVDFGVGALIALAGIILLAAVVAFARARRTRPAR